MASEGPLSAGTGANETGIGSTAWSNPGNLTVSDDSRATVDVSAGVSSNWLKATNFGFSIPSGATIDGIVVEWEKGASSTSQVQDLGVRIVKGGTIGSTDNSSGTSWPSSDAYTTYGTSSYLWGETWTDTNINASTFGAAIAAQRIAGAPQARIDHCRITVYYTAASASTQPPRTMHQARMRRA